MSQALSKILAGCSERPSNKAACLHAATHRRGASEEVKSYSLQYVEPLSATRTMLVDFVNSLLVRRGYHHATKIRSSRWIEALQRDDKHFLPLAPKAN